MPRQPKPMAAQHLLEELLKRQQTLIEQHAHQLNMPIGKVAQG